MLVLMMFCGWGLGSAAGAADCSSPDGVTGQIFYDESAGDQKRCDGSAWVSLGPVSGRDLSAVVPLGLVGYWSLDEEAGGVAADGSGGGNDGALINGAVWAEGRIRNGIGLGGSYEYVELGNPAALQITGDLTVAAWVKFSSFRPGGYDDVTVAKNNYWNGLSWVLKGTEDTGPETIAFAISGDGSSDVQRYGGTAISPDVWYHVAGVYDASAQAMHVYLNGTLDDAALSGAVPASLHNSSIAASVGTQFNNGNPDPATDGIVDDVRVYGRALSAVEVQELFEATAGCIDPRGVGGVMRFNASFGVMQYCDGLEWVAMNPMEGKGTYAPSGAGGGAPDAYSFVDVTNANPSTVTVSNSVTMAGLWGPTNVSVSGPGSPQVRGNGGAWATSASIDDGQTLEVRQTSSSSFSAAQSVTVDVGGVTDSWSVTTRAASNCTAQSKTWLTNCTATVSSAAHGANGTGSISNPGGCGTSWYGSATFSCSDGSFSYSSGTCTQQTACDTTPNAFSFTEVTGQALNTLITSNTITISGINTGSAVSVSGSGSPQISINGGGWVTSGTIQNGQSLRVRLTSANAANTARTASVNVGGVTDVWSVTTTAGVGCTTSDGFSMAHGSTTDGYCLYADIQCGNVTRCWNNERTLSCNNGVVSTSNCDAGDDKFPIKSCGNDCD